MVETSDQSSSKNRGLPHLRALTKLAQLEQRAHTTEMMTGWRSPRLVETPPESNFAVLLGRCALVPDHEPDHYYYRDHEDDAEELESAPVELCLKSWYLTLLLLLSTRGARRGNVKEVECSWRETLLTLNLYIVWYGLCTTQSIFHFGKIPWHNPSTH